MPASPSISRWDALDGKELIIYLDPGPCPSGAGWTSNGVYIRRGSELVHLANSRRLVEKLFSRKTIIVVEADEKVYRITRVSCISIGTRNDYTNQKES